MQNTKLYQTDERGKILERSNINFAPVISALLQLKDSKTRFPCLSGIDPYGDTYVNVHQVSDVIKELEQLKNESAAAIVVEEVDATIEFQRKIYQHTFAKFIGD